MNHQWSHRATLSYPGLLFSTDELASYFTEILYLLLPQIYQITLILPSACPSVTLDELSVPLPMAYNRRKIRLRKAQKHAHMKGLAFELRHPDAHKFPKQMFICLDGRTIYSIRRKIRRAWVQIMTISFTSCKTFLILPNVSRPVFSHPQNGDNNTYVTTNCLYVIEILVVTHKFQCFPLPSIQRLRLSIITDLYFPQ